MSESGVVLRAWMPDAVATLLKGAGAPTTTTLVLAGAAAVLLFASAVLALRHRSLRRRTDRVLEAAAKLFRRKRLNLDDLPGQLAELDSRVGELMRELDLMRRRRASPAKPSPPDAGTALIGTLVQLAAEARDEAERLTDRPEFVGLDDVLRIRRALAEIEEQVRGLEGDASPASALKRSLESSDGWNAALTTPAILEAYFDLEAYRPLICRMRAIEQVLCAAFGRLDIEIVVKRPLTPAGSDSPMRSDHAPRDLTVLPAVRERAARHARSVPDRAAIVVDCFSPGYVSQGLGKRAPRFTVYDPAT